MEAEQIRKKQKEEGKAASNKCKSEGCNNSRGYGSSRCSECTAKYRADKKS